MPLRNPLLVSMGGLTKRLREGGEYARQAGMQVLQKAGECKYPVGNSANQRAYIVSFLMSGRESIPP